MTKTQEELKQIKEEFETLNKKLEELTDDELEEVTGGEVVWDIAVKLKEKFDIIDAHGKNKKPTLPLWEDTTPGLFDDYEDPHKNN